MPMKNSEYWAQRMRMLEDALLDTGYDYVTNLETQFRIAQQEIEKDLARWYARFATNNNISLMDAKRMLSRRELEEFRWTVEEYIQKASENGVSNAFTKQLENASARVHISRLDSMKLQLQQQTEVLFGNCMDGTDQVLRHIYKEGYYHTAYEIQKGLGVSMSFHGIDERRIRKVLSRPWTPDMRTFRDRCWTNKQALVNSVNTKLTQMIMRGEAPDKAISAIAKEFHVSKSKAGRLVMTESAAMASASQRDCFHDLGVEQYIIIETLDGHTCPLCKSLDRKVFPMKDYQPGLTAPPFHPWCRGTTAPYFDNEDYSIAQRAARGVDEKTYYVPANMNYEQWRKTIKKTQPKQ